MTKSYRPRGRPPGPVKKPLHRPQPQNDKSAHEELQQSEDDGAEIFASNRQIKKAARRAKKRDVQKANSYKATVQDTIDLCSSEEEEVEPAPALPRPRSSAFQVVLPQRLPDRSTMKLLDIGQSLREIVKEFHSASNVREINNILSQQGLEDTEDTNALEENCHALTTILRGRRSTDSTVRETAVNDKLLVMRTDDSVQLCRAVESFQTSTRIRSRTTFGIIRKLGDLCPKMCAVSGYGNTAHKHARLLDSKFWVHEVFQAKKHYSSRITSSPWEQSQGLPQGSHWATHVEPQLILWAVASTVLKLKMKQGIQSSSPEAIHEAIADMYLIRDMKKPPQFEVLVDHEVYCKACLEFRDEIERRTNMKIVFKLMNKVGTLKRKRGNRGYTQYGNEASCSSSDEFDDEAHIASLRTDIEDLIFRTTQAARIRNPKPRKARAPRAEKSIIKVSEKTVVRTRTESSGDYALDRNYIRRFRYNPVQIHNSIDDDDMSEYNDAPRRPRKSKSQQETPSRRPATRGSTTSPTETTASQSSSTGPSSQKRKQVPDEFESPTPSRSPSPTSRPVVPRGHYRFEE